MFIGTPLCTLNNYKYKHIYLGCQPFLFVNICFFVLANIGREDAVEKKIARPE